MTDQDDTPADPRPDERVADAASRLRSAGVPFVQATVVRREPPISAAVGDQAIVTAEGIVAGWIGGVGCAETAVVRESRAVVQAGEPKLIGLAPDPDAIDRPGLDAFPLTCHSGGTLEVFLAPQNVAPSLLVIGGSAIAGAITRGAADLDFTVTVVDPAAGEFPDATAVLTTTDHQAIAEEVGTASAVVVASVGEFDARGIAAAIALDATYIGLVASRRRAAEVTERAADLLGMDADAGADRVRSPAGLDIDAERPAEIGVSVLAELIAERATLTPAAGASGSPTSAVPAEAVDPVCGMTVAVTGDALTVEHDGETYYFCGSGCADAFADAPGDYLETH